MAAVGGRWLGCDGRKMAGLRWEVNASDGRMMAAMGGRWLRWGDDGWAAMGG
jgi:hypothetical protein